MPWLSFAFSIIAFAWFGLAFPLKTLAVLLTTVGVVWLVLVLGIPSRLVVFVAFAMCGLLSGIAGVMYVVEFGTINGTSAGGYTLQVVAAVVVGGVGIFGGTGTLVGAALGALFLGFIANALILIGLSQFWLQAIYGLVILVAVSADAYILRRLQRAASLNRSR